MTNGLSSAEAKQLLEKYGKNHLPPPEKASLFSIFLSQFKNVIVWVLVVASLISFFLGEWIDASVILAITVLNALLGFLQEWKSVRSIEELVEVEKHFSKVIRDGHLQSIHSDEIVPGDLVHLEAGDLVPADGTLVHETRFSVNEAALTGESATVWKKNGEKVFRGTAVVTGKGKFLVSETGLKTEIGQITSMLESGDKQTPLQIRLDAIGKKLVLFCVGIVIVIFLFGLWKGFPVYSLIMTSLSLGVAAIPEGLPAVVTIALAIGVQRMVKKKALVRKLTAVETLGCTTVICTDKTGTLTENSMRVVKTWGDEDLLFEIAAVCNSASETAGDPMERALILAAKGRGKGAEILDEIPFDSDRKRMSVLVKTPKGTFVYTKGAPEALCKTKEEREKIHEFSREGLRVLGFAYKESNVLDEEGLHFVGLIALHDPPRKGVKDSLKECKEAGMRVLMLTGDHKETAVAIAKELGIEGDAIEGGEINDKKLEHLGVLARVSAKHKMQMIDLFQKRGEVVAMTGDGVNDAPAIEKADIGIAMGITGTDVTKSVSDLIILDDNFNTIVHAVEEGRCIYDNIIKFTSYLFSCNLAEILIVFASIFFLEKSVLIFAPIHLLWINIVTDGLPAIALAMDPLSPLAMKRPPRKADAPLFPRSWFFTLIALAILISVLTIAIFMINLPKGAVHARTCAFTALVVFELSKPFLLRFPYKIGFANIWLIGAVLLSFILQAAVVYIPFFHTPFETASMNLIDWGAILIGLIILWSVGYPLTRKGKF
ncbi:MAG: cation-translocating P-type ATPase [Parachlamydiales bacterium]|nr:cation-translocating P-type ATPase [Parachlamydiales bacterium]